MKAIFILLTLFFLNSCETSSGVIRYIPMEKKKSVLFINFANNSVGDSIAKFDGLTKGIPDLIVEDFIDFGAFRPIVEEDRLRALKEIAYQQKVGVSDSTLVEAGKMIGAQYILSGSFIEMGGSISVSARLVDVSTSETFAAASHSGVTGNLLAPPEGSIIKKTSLKLLSRFQFQITQEEESKIKKKIPTKEVSAVTDNYQGEKIIEEFKINKLIGKLDLETETEIMKKAKKYFKKALQEDPNYERAKQNLQGTVGLLPPSI